MPKFKNIRISKRGGGTRIQRVQVLANGKYKFVKNKASRSRKVTRTSKKRRTKRMARKKRRRGGRKFTLPIAPLAGLAAGLAKPAELAMAGDIYHAATRAARNYSGFDPSVNKFKVEWMMEGLLPLVVGGMIHKFVGGPPLNINRMLASAGVPVLRI